MKPFARSLLALLCLGFPLSAAADEGSAPKEATWVTFKSGADDVRGYLALPASGGKRPAIVVIQEWWGVNEWIEEQTRALASEGFVALAVDLYRGRIAKDRDEAHELMRGLPEDRALRDLDAGVAYLRARPDVDPDTIGCVGWCMGGSYSLSLAAENPRVKACVINYGRLLTDEKKLGQVRAAVLGSFGSEDRGISVESVKEFEATMKRLGKNVDVKIYEGAGHAFANPKNEGGYRPEAARDAWERTVGFFKKTLAAT